MLSHCSPHTVLLIANVSFSLVAIVITFYAARQLFDDQTALLASVLVLTNPLFLYYGSVTELYAYDSAFSAFLIVLLLVRPPRSSLLFFVYGLLGSFRLSSFILTMPVVLLSFMIRYWKEENPRRLIRDLLGILMGLAVWLIPFLIHLGSIRVFLTMVHSTSDMDTRLWQNLATFLPVMVWMLNGVILLLVLRRKQVVSTLRTFDERYIVLLALIVVPGLFFAFKYYTKGYALIYLAPLCVLAARLIISRPHRGWRIGWSAGVVSVNLALFFFVPYWEPSVRSTFGYGLRTSTERWESAVLRTTSYAAPSFAHVQSSQEGMRAANALMDLLQWQRLALDRPLYVLLDGPASYLASPRSLQAMHPEITFLLSRPDDSTHVRWFHADSTGSEFDLTSIDSRQPLFYVTTSALKRELGSIIGNRVASRENLVLYSIPFQARAQFVRVLDSLFINRS